MPRKQEVIKPFYVDTDTDYSELKPSTAPFLKSVIWDIDGNPETGAGTNNPTGEGQNLLAISTTRSNERVPSAIMPSAGWNKTVGAFESVITSEMYHMNYNSTGQHGIYVKDGNSDAWAKVIIDPDLDFSDDAEAFMANHRVTMRVTKDKDGNIIEKYLMITDGQSWHKYIGVVAAIKTGGYNSATFPYWELQPPHFDRRELLEWAVRPIMQKPIATAIPNTASDSGKINQIIDKAFQFSVSVTNTDGRFSPLSPYSLPVTVSSTDFLNSPDSVPKNIKLKFPAGSPLTESITIFVRRADWDKNTYAKGMTIEWGDWFQYDIIDKFTSTGVNSAANIGNDYWKRQNPWSLYNYDATFNTVEYIFDNSKVYQIIDQSDANMIETGMPQLSVAMTDLGDSVLLGDNRYGYPNFDDDVMDKLDVSVEEKAQSGCALPLRTIYLYAYIGRCGDTFSYTSQVGYYLGNDKKVRFGGLHVNTSSGDVILSSAESDTFKLDFADKNALQVYLKGTPYSAVGEWYYVATDNTLHKLDGLYDFSVHDIINVAGGILAAGGYFVCRFKVLAPAGRYIATIGRHNVLSTGDYRNESTYIYGVANSRVKSPDKGFITIKPAAIVDFSKEMEIDCTSGDVDVWGNNKDLFYVYCPYATGQGNLKYRFIEGYLKEINSNPLPVEMFPYQMTHAAVDDYGVFTDKNGFYWAYTKVANSDSVDVQIRAIINCGHMPAFTIPTSQGGTGWKQNSVAYLATYNSGVVGDCNRVVYSGKITDLAGTTNYSNIAISIKDGSTVYTKSDGTFSLIIHNGKSAPRVSSVYVNAGGSFIITIAGCGYVPLYSYDENFVACINCTLRTYPIPLNLGVKIDSQSQTSLKEGSKYSVGIYAADFAGRVMFVNEIKSMLVPSFLKRNNTNATFFKLLIASGIDLTRYPDMKWIFPCVSKNLSQRRYLDWVGDSIIYIDGAGNAVTETSNAVFCAINISSLINYNISHNFSVLAGYQFVSGDRLRILDNGDGQLFDVATYGEGIDVEVLGTNFNQAAINAGLLPQPVNTVAPASTTVAQNTLNTSVTLIVRYDARFDKLAKDVGIWIETYTPTKETDNIPYMEVGGAYPIINGKPAEYTGGGAVNPQYNYLTSIDIDFWDTYYLNRSIPIVNVGNKFFSHIFQSVNITDNWGREITSGGRRTVKNKLAKQTWYGDDTIKSGDFVKEGLVNGLAYFTNDNRRSFSTYPFGSIVVMRSERNVIGIYCENDYFMVDYNFHYTFANEQGVMVTNLNDGLSTPHQKLKGKYGIAKRDTNTFVNCEEGNFWLDSRNTAFVKLGYKMGYSGSFFGQPVDVSQLTEEEGEKGGLQSYLNSKLQFINNWNNVHPRSQQFDAACGVDMERGCVYLTFRNRMRNSNENTSYGNDRRDIDLAANETVVYSIQYHGWLRWESFAPEAYCKLRGTQANVEMYTFAAGIPYAHNNTSNRSYLNFFGVQYEPVMKCVFNAGKQSINTYQSFSNDSNPNDWFIDMMYTNFVNSFSYLSVNKFTKKETMYYADILRNMNSYPSNNPADLFRSMLFDGYRMFGRYLVFRMVGSYKTLNQYNQINNIYLLEAESGNNKK